MSANLLSDNLQLNLKKNNPSTTTQLPLTSTHSPFNNTPNSPNASNQLTMSSTVLADRDINAPAVQQPAEAKADVKTMEYHRQVLQSKLDESK